MKITKLFISLLLTAIMFSCKPSRKLQKTQEAVSKTYSSSSVVTKENKITDSTTTTSDSATTIIDSASLIKDVYNKVISNKIDFNTFNAKVKVAYSDKDGGDDATAFVRVKKDSLIWMSLRGPLGIEGFRVLVSPDSVKLLNLLKKTVEYRSIDFLQQVSGLPLNFSALQDILVGNPVFIDSNIQSYTSDSNRSQILMTGKIFKHLAIFNNNDYKIVESKLNDINHINRACDIIYGGYENGAGGLFSTERKISLNDESKLDISLNFKQYSFNQPVTFPFNISDNYRRL